MLIGWADVTTSRNLLDAAKPVVAKAGVRVRFNNGEIALARPML